jgi:hypothetical protein
MTTPTDNSRVDALRLAPLNSWVALSEDESKVIASGVTYEEVVSATERLGVADPIIVKTPSAWLPFSV